MSPLKRWIMREYGEEFRTEKGKRESKKITKRFDLYIHWKTFRSPIFNFLSIQSNRSRMCTVKWEAFGGSAWFCFAFSPLSQLSAKFCKIHISAYQLETGQYSADQFLINSSQLLFRSSYESSCNLSPQLKVPLRRNFTFLFSPFFTQNNLPSCTMSFRPERKN